MVPPNTPQLHTERRFSGEGRCSEENKWNPTTGSVASMLIQPVKDRFGFDKQVPNKES